MHCYSLSVPVREKVVLEDKYEADSVLQIEWANSIWKRSKDNCFAVIFYSTSLCLSVCLFFALHFKINSWGKVFITAQ